MTFANELKSQQQRWDRIRFNLWPLGHCMRFGHRMHLIIDEPTKLKPRKVISPGEFLGFCKLAICFN